MERIAEIVNYWKPLTIFAKHSMLDVWQGCEYASKLLFILMVRGNLILYHSLHSHSNLWFERIYFSLESKNICHFKKNNETNYEKTKTDEDCDYVPVEEEGNDEKNDVFTRSM